MHLFFLTRGIKHDRDRMVEQLASLHFPWMIKNKKGKEERRVVQGHLQPIELWSYVFPEEHLDGVLRTLKPSDSLGIPLNKNHIGYGKGSPARKMSLTAIRKAMSLKKIPKWSEKGDKYPIWANNMQIVGIGIKEDYRNEYGNECL